MNIDLFATELGVMEVFASEDEICNSVLACRGGELISVIVFRGQKMQTCDSAFDEMSAALQFPYYFGNNWNAFDECLNDPDWMPRGRLVIVLTHAERLFAQEKLQEHQVKTLVKILERASVDWTTGTNGRKLELSCVLATQK